MLDPEQKEAFSLDSSSYFENQDIQKDRFLTFTIDKEIYGIEINYVSEIVEILNITELPKMPAFIKGIINLRSSMVPVMDVRPRFKKAMKEYDDRTSVIVVDFDTISIGLVVDSVLEVMTIDVRDILEYLNTNAHTNNKYIKKIGKCGQDIILILDCDNFISEEELTDINSVI